MMFAELFMKLSLIGASAAITIAVVVLFVNSITRVLDE